MIPDAADQGPARPRDAQDRDHAAAGPDYGPMNLKDCLEQLYGQYNRREFVHPDPLEFLYDYPEDRHREIVGLFASALAYGRVAQILKSVRRVLRELGDAPADFLSSASSKDIQELLPGFKHRFTTGEDVSCLLEGVRQVIQEHGSLGNCFQEFFQDSGGEIIPALSMFVNRLRQAGNVQSSFILPSPEKGSACKRLFLYLRWMVRSDEVDPGGWSGIPASALLIPLDTHMHHIAQGMGFTARKQANLRTAIEITEHFRTVNPEDPVKYDFVLTRFGIREELDRNSLEHLLPSRELL